MKNKNLYIMVGAPGAGKTYYTRAFTMADRDIVISRDKIRFSLLKRNDAYFGKENIVFDIFVKTTQKALDNEDGPDNIWVDATFINEKSRAKFLRRLNLAGVRLVAVVVRPDLATHLAHNSNRKGRAHVPESIITDFYERYEDPAFDTEFLFDRVEYNEEGAVRIWERPI